MTDHLINLLGAVGLAVADRLQETALALLHHAGETPAALVVIGHGQGPSNNQLRQILRLSHPGTVRLVDRLVADGLVERRQGRDKRAIALHLTERGEAMCRDLLQGRRSAIKPFVASLNKQEQGQLEALLRKMLICQEPTQAERRTLCRFCDQGVCTNCPIPADIPDGA